MNPDVFITVVFCAVAVVVALAALMLVVPTVRREDLSAREGAELHRPAARR